MRVLVVDDSDITRAHIRGQLEHAGYSVEEARNGSECLSRVRANPPDAVTLDVTLPDLDGFDVCTRLRGSEDSRISGLPVIFVTAKDTLTDRARGFEVGAADFINKGGSGREITAALNRILQPTRRLEGMVCLVVEDSEISRTLLRRHLVEEGVTVLEAVDGVEGLARLSEDPERIDMVITDMRMPKMNGDELCRKIRNSLGLVHLPVIIVSVVDDRESMLEVFKVGATDYLLKPYIREELIARLNSHLHVRLLNERLSQRVEELRELNRIKDRFLTVVSQNLEPPAKALDAAVRELGKTSGLPRDVRSQIDDAVQRSERLLTLMSDLLGD